MTQSARNKPPKYSMITAVMNRNEIVTEGIENWLSFDFVDEIIVVDWSSKIPFTFKHEKVKVYRVENEKTWILSQAYNLAASLASGSTLIKMDSDYRLNQNINKLFPPPSAAFLRGNWKFAKNQNEKYINGFIIVPKKYFDKVGGYNEEITTYGYDDSNLYNRLREIGLKEILLSVDDGISHKPHDEELRTINQDTKSHTKELITQNEKISYENQWSCKSKKVDWNINKYKITRKN